MRVRTLLILTSLVSSLLGSVVAYLVLTVPNDLAADGLLKSARASLAAGREPEARESLTRIVQQHPRTDAAAAATVALLRLGEQSSVKLESSISELRRQMERDRRNLGDLSTKVTAMASAPPKTVVVQAPPPAPRKTEIRKAPPVKKKTTRQTTRRRRG